MNPCAEKWRVRFVPVAPARESACERAIDGPGVEVWRDVNGQVCAWGYVAEGYGWVELVGTAKFRLDARKREVAAFALPGVGVEALRDAYTHAALPLALHYFGCEVLHASAVRTAGGVVAFCAVSETGKSTMAAALSGRGHALWADDSVALDRQAAGRGPAKIESRLLPFVPRLRQEPARHLDDCAGRVLASDTDGAFAPRPLAALCVMERAKRLRGDAEIRRLAPAEAFRALLPHAFCFSLEDPARKRAMLRLYLDAAAQIPAFAISFTPGFERLPRILDAIEERIPAFRRSAPYADSTGACA